ncbi:hypothetical protein RFI_00680 [Reticulomyxa filosa]|uniref:Uncharacterized protein n=1 Tax=Reticulomyxa filosa TaxID=46433 RepID=X6PFF5_RETFI|nr:hypothetical protein RFI_00680 [Reticulomyxa filosa]|eukprot:ETO36382.1 hypothetical protein RFI_00680 [Reticulomyxa filosa]
MPNSQLGTILVMSLSYSEEEDENESQEDGDNNPIKKKKKAEHNLIRVYVTIISFGSICKYFFLLFLRLFSKKKKLKNLQSMKQSVFDKFGFVLHFLYVA